MASSAEPDPALLPIVAAALSDGHHVIVGGVDVPAGRPDLTKLETAQAEAEALRPADRVRLSGAGVRVVVVDPDAERAGDRFDRFVARLTAVPARRAVVSCCEARPDESAEALLARLDTWRAA